MQNEFSPNPAPAWHAGTDHFPAADAFADDDVDARSLPADEQLARFLLWLKVQDAGHQPC